MKTDQASRSSTSKHSSSLLWRWFKRLLILGFSMAVLSALAIYLVIRHYEQGLPSTEQIENDRYRPPQVTRVFARDGKTVLAEVYTERRTWVPIETLPAQVKLAFLAAEDAHFYEHEGVNYLGIVRALVVNLRSGRTKQGASTITQQVGKNTLLDARRTYGRKIREALLAHHIEKKLSKDQIFELYLNQIYLGHGRYGVEEASKYYFGEHAKDLSLARAAALAGLVASPGRYSHNPSMAERRRTFVLRQMRDKGFVDRATYEKAIEEKVVLRAEAKYEPELAPEVVSIAKKTLKEAVGERARLGGYSVITSIDPRLQRAARAAVRANLRSYDRRHGLRAPFRADSRRARRRLKKLFEGTPKFQGHRVYVGKVTGADDKKNTLHVRVGTVNGVIHLDDYARYVAIPKKRPASKAGKKHSKKSARPAAQPPTPHKLLASEFAEVGAPLRVSLLAPPPDDPTNPKAPLTPLRLEEGPESALVAIDVRSGEIRALIGSYEGAPGGLDRATQTRRQPGSTFKPIVYSYAIHTRQFTAASMIDTQRGSVAGYRAKNYDPSEGEKPMRLREALAHSVNVAALHVAKQVGPKNIVQWARQLGITSKLGADLSIALGSYEVRPVEIAAAYTAFAFGGTWRRPRLILQIRDSQGRTIELPPSARPVSRTVMPEDEAYIITSLLTSVIDHGTGRRANVLRRPLAGKTGTTNKSKDGWFVGYSTDITCAVWTGYDDATSLGAHETGASSALPAWISFMKSAHASSPPTQFPRPPSVRTVRIDPSTGLLARPDQQDAIDEVFLAGTEPSEVAPEDAGVDSAAPESADAGLLPTDSDSGSHNETAPNASTEPTPLPAPTETVPLF